ncbi:MAG: ATP-binding protein [Muribaculaceae bacterium]|nr:ATP-binding protein [Muribaculaceae bacterium]
MSQNNPIYQRVTVSSVAPHLLTVRCRDGKELKMPVTPAAGYDFSSLLPRLKPGVQLNLVNLHETVADEWSAELVIYEPDYLYDITGIAECFETYAASPVVSLLKRIKPEVVTRHILLGSFAGLLLDEAVRSDGSIKLNYNDLATNFFRTNAVRIAVCDDLTAAFHNDVRRQQKNIEKAVSVSMRAMPGYDADKVILEPSFFCEMLGLQGRMDLLQTDYSILVEQKSGKGEFGSSESGRPVHRLPHLIQLTLYRAVLHYGLNVPDNDINSYLLYSKYPEPLLHEQSAPRLLHAAIEMRNRLVCQEMDVAFGDGTDKLATLRPDSFDSSRLSPRFWNEYVRPDLERTLAPINHADPLEREYAMRLLRFVALEQYYSKVGSASNSYSDGFASAWKSTLDEKINSGNILHGLSIEQLITDENDAITAIVVRKTDDNEGEMPNFRVGDIVTFYPYPADSEPDMRAGIVLRCTVDTIADDTVTVRLRAPQTNRSFFSTGGELLWAMEHDLMDSGFRSLWRNINLFLAAPESRRQLILGTRQPRVNRSRHLTGDYGSFNPLVEGAIQAEELYIIIGPPGTGKTSHGLMNILTEELAQPGSSAILGAYTNRAVDEICDKLCEHGIDFIRVGTSSGCSGEYAPYMIGARVNECKNIAEVRKLLTETRVIVGTTQSLTANIALFSLRGFSLAIIDEASQILEPQLLGLLSATHGDTPAIAKFILIGDHKQLPAVVKQSTGESAVTSPTLQQLCFSDCRRSFFERHLDLIRLHNGGKMPVEYVYTLANQGRMHASVADIASEFFYGSQLEAVPLAHQHIPIPQIAADGIFGELLNRFRNIFVNVESPRPVSMDNANLSEAAVTAELLKAIYQRERDSFNPEKTVGVIVPYRNQIAAVKRAVSRLGIAPLTEISVDTVERYQGSQRDYIIYSFTVKRADQFPFLTSTRFEENGVTIDRKLNVALTRSRSHNILVGNVALLRTDPLYSRLIDTFALHGTVVDAQPE